MRLLLIALVTTTSLQAQTPYGYDWLNSSVSPGVIKRSAASQSSAPSSKAVNPWRLSVGYAVRSFEADFKMSAPSIGLIAPYLGGFGDVGFYRGGSGFLNYEDGYVGPSNGDGTAGGQVTSTWTTPDGTLIWDPSRFLSPGSIAIVGGPGDEDSSTITFHTKTFQMLNQEESAHDRGTGSGPYVRLGKTFIENDFGGLGFSATWTNLRGSMDGIANFGHPTRTDFNYTYDQAKFYGPGEPPGVFVYGLVVDANQVNDLHNQAFGTPGHYRDPRKTTTQFDVPEWTAIGSSYLDVRLNEIFLSADVTWKPWHGWEFGLSAGPTINVVSTTLNSRTSWFRSDGLTVAGETTRRNETHVALGAGVQGVARHDLTSDGRAFVEAHAGYRWLSDIAINGPSSSAKLDLSDWEVGLGVGIRLDDWPAGSPWTVRVGADSRRFSLRPGPGNESGLKSMFTQSRPSVGLFNGRDTIQYDDGKIYGNGNEQRVMQIGGGADRFTIDGSDQAEVHNVIDGPHHYVGGHIVFHSSSFRESLTNVQASGVETTSTVISPSIAISKVLFVGGPLSIGVDLGWSSATELLGMRSALSGIATTRRINGLHTYSYPYYQNTGDEPIATSNYPFTGDGLIADPRAFISDSPTERPQHSSSQFSDTIHYFALTSASVDVSMQTLSFATDLSWKPLRHLEVGVSAGPTVNVVSTSTDLTTDWIRQDGLLFARLQDHETQTQLCFGWRMLASARYDLDRDGRWFAEARGGYEWMQNIDLGIGLQAASLDASSWQVGAGLGCRLGVKPKMSEIRRLSAQRDRAKPKAETQNWRDRLLRKTRTVTNTAN